MASLNGHRAVVELLLENGADVSICNEVNFQIDFQCIGSTDQDYNRLKVHNRLEISGEGSVCIEIKEET